MVALPAVDHRLPLVNTELECVQELREDPSSFEDFLRSASVELNQHIEAIREAGRHEWRPGAIAGLAHSIKGLGLNFGFDQLVDYAFKVQRIEGDIVQSQIPELASTFETLVVAVFNEVHQPL